MFILLCAVCMVFSGYTPSYVLYELFGRLSRNMFIVLSLIIPIIAGMGINFAITIGAMAAQIACLLVLEWGVPGIAGLDRKYRPVHPLFLRKSNLYHPDHLG